MDYVQVHSDVLKELIRKIDDLQANVNALHRRLGTSLVGCKQAADEWGCSVRTVSRWIAEGKVHPVNSTGRPKFTLDEINRVKGIRHETL